MFGEHFKKIKQVNIKSKKFKKILPYDEIVGEQKICFNQGYMRTIYKFENDRAVYCINELESDNELLLEEVSKEDKLTKNIQRDGNVVRYEWSDEYFEEKGKGCSKEEIKKFLKALKYKIKGK